MPMEKKSAGILELLEILRIAHLLHVGLTGTKDLKIKYLKIKKYSLACCKGSLEKHQTDVGQWVCV